MGAAEVAVLADDLANIVDAECLGAAGKDPRLVEGVEDMDWHVALLVAYGCRSVTTSLTRGGQAIRADLGSSDQGEHAYSGRMLFWRGLTAAGS